MAVRHHLIANLWQKARQDSVTWGSLALWISGLILLLIVLTIFSRTLT